MITIVDYQAGNLTSVEKAFAYLGCAARVTDDPQEVERAERIVLPGVGHFRATARLGPTGLSSAIQRAISTRVPFLGICVGMQWLYEGSAEAPGARGLGLLAGSCVRFAAELKSPHVGWNQVRRRGESRLLRGMPDEFFVYYTHSYSVRGGQAVVGETEYGGPFTAVVERGNIFGVQFHPEKSGAAGLALLENFGRLSC